MGARTVANAKQYNIVQFSLHVQRKGPGELFLDLSAVKRPKPGMTLPKPSG